MPRYIDADALKDVIQQHDYPLADRLNSVDNGMFTLGIFQAIDQMPTISPDEVRDVGKWIRIPGFHLDHEYHPARYQCDQCKHFVDSGDDKNYCPNCGTKMEVSENA